MKAPGNRIIKEWLALGPQFLPFADAASRDLPLGRLLRLALFQVSVGMAFVLLSGTLNRVMIVELGVPAWLVATMVALPLLAAPFRALIGHRSDSHRSYLGWRRVPYIWMGTLLQFGGLAIMPFALMVLSGDNGAPVALGQGAAMLAFLLTGVGLHTTQTAGLALATDLAPVDARPRVVALLYVMLLLGTIASALVFGVLLAEFTPLRLVQVVQGAALATMLLNIVALWQQEARDPTRTAHGLTARPFRDAWSAYATQGRTRRFLLALGLGTAAFSMQDILLEPYGAQILGLSVSATTLLTAFAAAGTLAAFALAARHLARGGDPYRLAACGALVGVFAFAGVIFAAPLDSATLFRVAAVLIGFGGGLFAVGTLVAAMAYDRGDSAGLALGAWGAVQATAMGMGVAAGGILRDFVGALAASGQLGAALVDPATGYAFVYHLEIGLLFITLVVIGPLVRSAPMKSRVPSSPFGLAEFPG